MKITLSIILATLCAITAFGQQPFTQKLQSLASITFPGAPKLTSESSNNVYIYKDSISDIYFAQVSPLTKSFGDMLTTDILDTVYNGYIKGALGPVNGTIIYKKRFEKNGLKGIEFDYKVHIKDNIYYAYQNAFYFNDTVVSYAVWSRDSLQRDDKKIASFFNTFKLKIKTADISQNNADELAHKTGSVIGYAAGIFLTILVVVLLGLLVVFLIKKLTK